MISSGTSVKHCKSGNGSPHPEKSNPNSKVQKLSSRNGFNEFRNRILNFRKSAPQSRKPTETGKQLSSKDKVEKPVSNQVKDPKKVLFNEKLKEEGQGQKKNTDRDYRRIKTKYNSSIGNILREWVNLIYCILILRMNLIKFIVEKFPDFGQNDVHLQKQIVLESKTIYKIIRKAQHFSQEQFLYMWSHLDKLILNRTILKNALDAMQMKETGLRDWRAASEKLCQLQQDLEKAQNTWKAIQKSKTQFELSAKEKLLKLESLTNSRNAEMEQLVQQITELKNNEVQTRGKILLNMKSYKDLKSKRRSLINIEKEKSQLKNEQIALIKEYNMKIQLLKNQVEAKDEQIKIEKEEKKKLKASLVGFGDFSEKANLIALQS